MYDVHAVINGKSTDKSQNEEKERYDRFSTVTLNTNKYGILPIPTRTHLLARIPVPRVPIPQFRPYIGRGYLLCPYGTSLGAWALHKLNDLCVKSHVSSDFGDVSSGNLASVVEIDADPINAWRGRGSTAAASSIDDARSSSTGTVMPPDSLTSSTTVPVQYDGELISEKIISLSSLWLGHCRGSQEDLVCVDVSARQIKGIQANIESSNKYGVVLGRNGVRSREELVVAAGGALGGVVHYRSGGTDTSAGVD